MHHFKSNLDRQCSPLRSLTPYSNCSSNYSTVLNDSSGNRTNYNALTYHRGIDDDFNRNKQSGKIKPPLSDSITSVLIALESDLKKLDFSFEFSRVDDHTSTAFSCIREAAYFLINKVNSAKTGMLSSQEKRNSNFGEMCSSCVKVKNLMDEAKFSIEREKESLENTEKHLKHYDSLLAIKENRLREQELSFENERNLMEIQKSEICREKLQVEKEKESISMNLDSLNNEKDTLEKQMIQLEKKYQDVRKILSDYESQKSGFEQTIRSEMSKSIELRESQLKEREQELAISQENLKFKIRQFEKSYQEKISLFEKLKQEVITKQKIIIKKKEKIVKLKKNLSECVNPTTNQLPFNIEAKIKELNDKDEVLRQKSEEIDNYHMKLNDEKCKLEMLKRTLQEEKAELDMEVINNRRSCHEKVHQAQLAEERYKEKLIQTEIKEKRLEEMIRAMQEEENKLDERWKNLENVHLISSELNQIKEKYNLLQKNYSIQHQELQEYKSKVSEKPLQMSFDMKDRLEILKKKEEDLMEIEQQLKKEREEIDISSGLIRQLNEDLSRQKQAQQKEQHRLSELARDLKIREKEATRLENSNLDIEKSFKNSSSNSMHKILVSEMSPFDDKDIFHLEIPFTHDV